MTSNEINIENIILILRMHARLIAGVFTLAILVAVVITYQMPKMYSATTLLNFEFYSNNPLENQESKTSLQDSYITTQIGILTSLNVAQKTVDDLSGYEEKRLKAALIAKASIIDDLKFGLKRFVGSLFNGDSRGSNGNWAGAAGNSERLRVHAPYEQLARWMGMDLVVVPLVNSRIVEVSYLSTDPKIAAFMADRIAEAYIATNLKMVTDPAYSKKVWFDEQLKSLRASLEEAQTKLTSYQQKEGIVSSDERFDLESSRLQNLANQLVEAQDATRKAETSLKKLNDVRDSGASLMTFDPVFSNSVVQKVRSEIRNLEGQLVESSISLGASHPKIVRLKSELSAARYRLNNEIESITDGIVNAADLAKQRENSIARVW